MANKLRLLRFPEELIEFIRESGLSERHARGVLRLPETAFKAALEHVASRGLTVAQTEAYVEKLLAPEDSSVRPVKAAPPRPRAMVRDARIFINTINRAFDVMRESGIRAVCERRDLPDAVEMMIRIPK